MLVGLLSMSNAALYTRHKDVRRQMCRFPSLMCTQPTRMLVDLLSIAIHDLYSAHRDRGRLFVDSYP
eukprot:11262038-Prorocentrum_lima.AAC.1